MCGIAGILSFHNQPISRRALEAMNRLQAHRGPDGQGVWIHPAAGVGLGHTRLSIIDLEQGAQPMSDAGGNVVSFNGEIYNYLELREELGPEKFRTHSDTETILHAWRRWGRECCTHFRGMFAFALWDESAGRLFLARDRFGVKPLYYTVVQDTFLFASEIKTLLPFLPTVQTSRRGLRDYLTFQYCLNGKTLFRGIRELPPGHWMEVVPGSRRLEPHRYWEVYFEHDFEHEESYFEDRLRELLLESVRYHLRSDVPLGGYVSGGLDSGIIAALAARQKPDMVGFTGKFSAYGSAYDESSYARRIAEENHFPLLELDITAEDFIRHIRKVIYHLDFPVAGPGSFPQYLVSALAARHRKVVLGGQGGDEIFGGYVRYLAAYFEQCIRGAIEGTLHNGNFLVTYESIIPNLVALQNYKPMLQHLWAEGLFESMDRRYFRLIDRSGGKGEEIRWDALAEADYDPFEAFREIFYGQNVRRESYFDLMTHFDFKTLLPALLQVEDRMSMAHGLESRVPLLDHPLIEFAATIPPAVKFQGGTMKRIFRKAVSPYLPPDVLNRTDKMGFATPLTRWLREEARSFVLDLFHSQAARTREYIDYRKAAEKLHTEGEFSRRIWGLLCLELWWEEFHDRHAREQIPLYETGT